MIGETIESIEEPDVDEIILNMKSGRRFKIESYGWGGLPSLELEEIEPVNARPASDTDQ